jgi:hypothetical protein
MTVRDWCRFTGTSRTKFYSLKKRGLIKTVKLDGRRLVDVQVSLAFLECLPED